MLTVPTDALRSLSPVPSDKRVPGKAPAASVDSKETEPFSVSLSASAKSLGRIQQARGDTVEVSQEALSTLQSGAEEERAQGPASQDAYAGRIRDAIAEMQKRVTTVQFRVEMETDEVVVKIINKESGETIREIPSEEVRAMQQQLRDMRGLLLRDVT